MELRKAIEQEMRDCVVTAFEVMLGREPESEETLALHAALPTASEIVRTIGRSEEFFRRTDNSVFSHYNTFLNAPDIIRRYIKSDVKPASGYLTNFLGVQVDPKVNPQALAGRAGEIEPAPLIASWHADIAEWAAVLRAIDLAQGTFTMAELGCGWGCWMTNAGVAARNAGLDIHVIGVEGDEAYVRFAQETLANNDIPSTRYTIHRGVAAATSGIALFPRQANPGDHYGLEPVFGASEAERDKAVAAGTHDALPMVPMDQVVAEHRQLDLLHIDIQGGEHDLISSCLDVLNERVAYMMIGTHSRQIEGQLMQTLLSAGWRLEMERPAVLRLNDSTPFTYIDGVQGWRNIRLTRLKN